MRAGEDTAMRIKAPVKGWFEENREELQPVIQAKHELLSKMRASTGEERASLRNELKESSEKVGHQIAIAKANLSRKKAIFIHKICQTPRQAWQAIKELIAGDSCHHNKPVAMKMKMKNGELASNDKQNMEVVEEHLNKVYNAKRERFADAAKMIKQREEYSELDHPITMKEFAKAIAKLKNGKAPGTTGVPPDAFKCLDGDNHKQIFHYVVDFWEGKADYWEWHTGLGVLIPKKGDLSDPNEWRGINLMDVCSKIFSCILNERLYRLLGKHGINTQFGATPEVGCQDGSFTLKTLLDLRRQHNLPTFVAFVDLVKAFDTTNHELLVEILQQYGAPPKL